MRFISFHERALRETHSGREGGLRTLTYCKSSLMENSVRNNSFHEGADREMQIRELQGKRKKTCLCRIFSTGGGKERPRLGLLKAFDR
jgi:hypothetical protein